MKLVDFPMFCMLPPFFVYKFLPRRTVDDKVERKYYKFLPHTLKLSFQSLENQFKNIAN